MEWRRKEWMANSRWTCERMSEQEQQKKKKKFILFTRKVTRIVHFNNNSWKSISRPAAWMVFGAVHSCFGECIGTAQLAFWILFRLAPSKYISRKDTNDIVSLLLLLLLCYLFSRILCEASKFSSLDQSLAAAYKTFTLFHVQNEKCICACTSFKFKFPLNILINGTLEWHTENEYF